MSLRRTAVFAAAVAAAALAVTVWRSVVPPNGGAGSTPELVFDEAHGAAGRLSALRGSPVLVAFLDTREDSTDGVENPDLSRRLLVFIESMRHQYSGRGLKVAIVDASGPAADDPPGRLMNFRFDRGLIDTPFTSGAAARQAMRDFAIRAIPTTLLIDRQGQVTSRWEGLVLASTLATAVARE